MFQSKLKKERKILCDQKREREREREREKSYMIYREREREKSYMIYRERKGKILCDRERESE